MYPHGNRALTERAQQIVDAVGHRHLADVTYYRQDDGRWRWTADWADPDDVLNSRVIAGSSVTHWETKEEAQADVQRWISEQPEVVEHVPVMHTPYWAINGYPTHQLERHLHEPSTDLTQHSFILAQPAE